MNTAEEQGDPSVADRPEPTPGEPGPTDEELGTAQPAKLRRAPRLGAFAVLGVMAGLIAALTGAYLMGEPPAGVGRGTIFVYLACAGVLFGGLAAGIAWLVADRLSRR